MVRDWVMKGFIGHETFVRYFGDTELSQCLYKGNDHIICMLYICSFGCCVKNWEVVG